MAELNPETWQRLESLFDQAIALEDAPRRQLIVDITSENATLGHRLERLLDSHDRTDARFIVPPEEHALGAAPSTDGAADRLRGKQLGSFTLTRRIAVGGMGAVYEAQQSAPQRTVAVKVLRSLFMTKSAARRFEIETETLGRLHHPNIAQIYEAGILADSDGDVPWFAMELLEEAQPITSFASQHDLTQAERLAMFLKVCDAVQYAHSRGVIHRDLKPGNILVADGFPKIIDFGIARSTDADVTRVTMQTGVGQILGTLQYMAPEQTVGDPRDIDVRCDVYSLGVVLFELLTGHMPLKLEDKPLTEAVRIIQQSPPARPSTINLSARGDLETIILKALDKEPARRYQSVDEFAADLRRFLAHEPIGARPPSTWHTMRLFARRNRTLVTAALLVAATLVVATIAVTVALVRAVDEKDNAVFFAGQADERAAEAEAQRHTAQEVSGFLMNMFGSIRPSQSLGEEPTVRELVDRAAERAERDLADQPVVLAEVLTVLGGTYRTLGQYEQAHALLTHADSITPEPTDSISTQRKATVFVELGACEFYQGKYAESEAHLRSAIDLATPIEAQAAATLADAHRWIGEIRLITSHPVEAVEFLESARQYAEQAFGADDPHMIVVLDPLARTYESRREWPRAIELHRAQLEIARASLPANHPDLALSLNSLANALHNNGEFTEAGELWEESLAILKALLPADHADIITLTSNLALADQARGDYASAERRFLEVIRLRKQVLGDNHPLVSSTLLLLGMMLTNSGEADRAIDVLEESVAVYRKALANAGYPDDSNLANRLSNLALAQRAAGRMVDAEATARAAQEIHDSVLEPTDQRITQTLAILGTILLETDQLDEAEPYLRRAYELRVAWNPEHWMTANSGSALGECLLKRNKLDEARPLIVTGEARLRETLGPTHVRRIEALCRVALLREAEGDSAAAHETRNELDQLTHE